MIGNEYVMLESASFSADEFSGLSDLLHYIYDTWMLKSLRLRKTTDSQRITCDIHFVLRYFTI